MYDALIVGGAWVSQPFGCTNFGMEPNCSTGCPHYHTGIDLVPNDGAGTPVRALGYGRVLKVGSVGTSCGSRCGGGNFGPAAVTVQFGNLAALYGHLESASVREGQAVSPGLVLGHAGTCGCSTGTHVHYEIDPVNCMCGVSDCCCSAVNPAHYLTSWPGSPTPAPGGSGPPPAGPPACPSGIVTASGVCVSPAFPSGPAGEALAVLLLGGALLGGAAWLAERESPGLLRREWQAVRQEAGSLRARMGA